MSYCEEMIQRGSQWLFAHIFANYECVCSRVTNMWTSVGSISALTGHIFISYEHAFPTNEYVDQCGIDLSTVGPYINGIMWLAVYMY